MLVKRQIHQLKTLIRLGALQELDDYQLDLSSFSSKALLQAQYNDKLYGLPLFLSTQTLLGY